MVKFKAPVIKEKVKRTSIRLPKAMVSKIDADMEKSGFNKKQRSVWFELIINELLALPNHSELIAEEFIVPGTTQPVAINIEQSLLEQIDQAVVNTKQNEQADCDRSAVIRTAVLQRLLKASGMQLSIKIQKGEGAE